MSLREAMREALVADAEVVDVPSWGRKVYIRPLAAKEQIAISKLDVTNAEKSLRILLVSIVDEHGERELADEDMDLLLEQPFPVLIPLLAASARINGFNEEELKAAVEDFGKAQSEHGRSA